MLIYIRIWIPLSENLRVAFKIRKFQYPLTGVPGEKICSWEFNDKKYWEGRTLVKRLKASWWWAVLRGLRLHGPRGGPQGEGDQARHPQWGESRKHINWLRSRANLARENVCASWNIMRLVSRIGFISNPILSTVPVSFNKGKLKYRYCTELKYLWEVYDAYLSFLFY